MSILHIHRPRPAIAFDEFDSCRCLSDLLEVGKRRQLPTPARVRCRQKWMPRRDCRAGSRRRGVTRV